MSKLPRFCGWRIVQVSPQEAKCLVLAAKGATDPEIAFVLGVSPWTVKMYWRKAKVKNGMRNRVALVANWIRENPKIDPVPIAHPRSKPKAKKVIVHPESSADMAWAKNMRMSMEAKAMRKKLRERRKGLRRELAKVEKAMVALGSLKRRLVLRMTPQGGERTQPPEAA